MKKIIVPALVLVVLAFFIFMVTREAPALDEQPVLEATMKISREYVALRYQTDNLLINAKDYAEYSSWDQELARIKGKWEALASDAETLEKLAMEIAVEKTSYNFIPQAKAYSREEVNDVFDKAPAGKKIATLAKHLGVDAKRAYAILTQEQNQIQAETWNSEGDTFKKLETAAIVIKDGCKVVGFVGTIAMTGGTAGLAAGGALAKTAVVVAGADLTLEVTEDAAKIALGDKNKISSIAGNARVITEPAAAILMVSTLPGNLTKGIDKLNAVAFGADSLRSAVQDGKVIGIKLPEYTKEADQKTFEVSVMEETEVGQWAQEQAVAIEVPTVAEVEKVLKVDNKIGTDEQGETTVQTNTEADGTGEVNDTAPSQASRHGMPLSEFNDLDDKGKLQSMASVKESFGEPDFSTINAEGRTVYVYFDLIKYTSGNSGSVRFVFYTLEDYKEFAESIFGWNEDYQETWDNSGGGIKASTEIKAADFFKSAYGI